MTPCARGCCFTGLQVCARQRTCPCHWEDRKPTTRNNGGTNYHDPTAAEAVRNVMRTTRKERR